jgi:hypothetical protein
MSNFPEFVKFPKIGRLNRTVVLTEKLDGQNASVTVDEHGNVFAASRTQWITTKNDVKGFAKFVEDNKEELLKLGVGTHFGEWWGSGINRGYGLTKGEKRFSLFNTNLWNESNVPACCSVVPVLYTGLFDTNVINGIVEDLRKNGSVAVPGFMKPEGIIVFHTSNSTLFKITLENDASPKGLVSVE